LGKFVGLFPQTDFWSFESQVFMTQHMKLDPLGAVHLLHASVHIKEYAPEIVIRVSPDFALPGTKLMDTAVLPSAALVTEISPAVTIVTVALLSCFNVS